MFKRIVLWASACLFLWSVVGLIVGGSAATLLKPQSIKSWGVRSNAYQQLPSVVIGSAAGQPGSILAPKDDVLRKAAQEAVKPAFFQKSTETIIDGTMPWLEGKQKKPEFSVSTLSAKEDLADALIAALKDRYQTLPECSNSLLFTADLRTITCRPTGTLGSGGEATGLFDIDQVINAYRLQILEDQSIFAQDTITATGLEEQSSDIQKLFGSSAAPLGYQWLQRAPVIFAVIAALSGVVVIALCQQKMFGLQKIGWRLLIAGVIGLLAGVLVTLWLNGISNMTRSLDTSTLLGPYQAILSNVLAVIRADSLRTVSVLSGLSVLPGVVLLLITRHHKTHRSGGL